MLHKTRPKFTFFKRKYNKRRPFSTKVVGNTYTTAWSWKKLTTWDTNQGVIPSQFFALNLKTICCTTLLNGLEYWQFELFNSPSFLIWIWIIAQSPWTQYILTYFSNWCNWLCIHFEKFFWLVSYFLRKSTFCIFFYLCSLKLKGKEFANCLC